MQQGRLNAIAPVWLLCTVTTYVAANLTMVTSIKAAADATTPSTPKALSGLRAAKCGLKLSPFRKLVRAIRPKYKWRRETLMEMKRRTEECVELLLKRSSLCAAHAGRNTVMPNDLALQALLLQMVPQEVTADPIPVGLANAVASIKANLQKQQTESESECESTVPASTDVGSVAA